MVAVVARADMLYAVLGYLRSYPELTALVSSAAGWKGNGSGPRISGEIGDGWKLPTRCIVLRKAGGPTIGDDYTMGIKTTRIDTFSYGASAAEADGVWAMLDAILVPSTGGDRAASFSLHGVRVADIRPEADAITQTEPDTNWKRVFASYIVTWLSAP